jgi:TFIIF-interacting CTD phosphatase-like protein
MKSYCPAFLKDEQLLPKNKNLILDLDNTLIFSEPLDHNNIQTKLDSFIIKDEEVRLYVIKERPYLRRFIKEINKYYNIGVWTASEGYYSEAIISNLFDGIDLSVVYLRKQCDIEMDPNTKVVTKIKKPISKIISENKQFDKTNTLVIDDNITTFEDNPENAIHVSSWFGCADDYVLFYLIDVLKEAVSLPDIRKIGQFIIDKTPKQKVTGSPLKIRTITKV